MAKTSFNDLENLTFKKMELWGKMSFDRLY